MRYGQGSGYTPAEQQRERLRLEAAGRFAAARIGELGRNLWVTEESVPLWHRADGPEALRSVDGASPQQRTRLELEPRPFQDRFWGFESRFVAGVAI